MPASEILLWQVAQGLNLALVPAIFTYLLWKREWTWTGLYIALCCAGAGWAQLNTLATVLGSADTAQRALATGAAMRAALFLGAAIGALRKPATVSTFMVLGACLFLGYTGANALYRDLFGLDPAGSYAIGGRMVPDWAGLPTMVLFALGPCLIGLPWTLARQSNLQESLVSAAHERYAIVFGLGIAAFVIVSCGMLAWAYVGHGPFSGERLQPALALETNGLGAANLAVWVIMGAGMFVFWAFPRHFIEQAAKLIEASERTDVEKLADIAPPMWRALAESLDLRREEARRSSREAEEARAQLSAFFEHVPVNMSLHGLDGRYVLGSGQVAKSYGISEEELRVRDMQSLARHWPKFEQLAEATIKVVTTGETQRIVTPFRSGDADEHVYDVVIFPIHSADGRIVQIGSLGIDITAQDKLLAELETRNSSMQAFFDNAPLLMYTSDLDDIVTTISDWPVRETGSDEFNPARALGRPVSESTSPAWTEFAERSFQAAVERSETTTAEIPLHYAGKERQTLSVRFPIKDSTGKVVQIGGYILDISAQKESETALAEREAMLAGIFDHAPVAITVFSRERRMVAANRAATGAYGMTRVGKRSLPVERFRPFWPEFDRFVELGLKVFETGERQQFNIAFNPPRGAPQEIKEAVYFPIFSSTGEVAQVGLFMIDVTERARAQEELNRSSATLQAFFDNLPGMAFIASKDDRYLAANSFLADALGLEQLRAENLLGKPTTDFVPPHWVEIIAEANRAALEEGRLFAAETTLELADGEHHIWASRFPIRDAAGEATQIGGLLFDRTVEKRAEAELNASRESLHQSEKLAALGQLLAGVAHELNNPLTVVVGRSAILEEKLRETPHGKAIADLREAADRCNRIVRTFLAMARQSAPRRAAVQVNDAIEAALDMTAYGLRSSGIELVRKLDANLPEVEADEDQLVQVFTNLLINARHALEEHRPEGGKVTITTKAKADKLLVEIADNGAGVPAEIVSRIFEPFFTTKAVGDGTGMGLAMSKGMIEEHGGRLLCSNAPNGGAVFTVELPIAVAAESAKPESALEPVQAKGRGRVLVVDDEPSIRGLLVEILEGIELDCTECTDGAAALGLLANEQFDLIFCDVRMPVMDGVRFRQRLAETHPEMLDRLVFISGDVLQRGQSRRAEIADHPFVEKPFNPAEVRRLALSLLGGEGDKS